MKKLATGIAAIAMLVGLAGPAGAAVSHTAKSSPACAKGSHADKAGRCVTQQRPQPIKKKKKKISPRH